MRLSLNSGKYLGSEWPIEPSNLKYLYLLWPQSLCDLIVVETNRYARLRKKCNWVDVDIEEMRNVDIYVGIMGYISYRQLFGTEKVCLAYLL